MKKIFKALALILALTLVIGAIPVSAAESSTGLSLKSKKRSLYIDGAKGLKEDGTKCNAGAEYKVTKLIKGFNSKTMTVALKSSKPAVVSTKGKKIVAESLGKATVTISVKSKTGTILDTLKLKVKVKKNAKDIVAYVTDVDGNLIAPGDKLGLNVPYVVTLTRKDPATGKQVDTDYRSLTCSDNSVVIKPVNSYTTQYAVTFTKMGKFTFTAGAYQSKIYPKAHTTAELEVVAGYTAVAAEQSALDGVKVTFDTKVSGLDKSLFKVYYKVKDAKISAGDIKDVKGIVYGEDGNTVYINFLRNFFGGREYFVEFNGEVVGSFVAVTVNQDSPKQVVILTETVQANVKTLVDYQILDENGIDIKNEVGPSGKLCRGTIKFELPTKPSGSTINKYGELTLAKVGDTAEVKISVDWRDSKNTPLHIEAKQAVVAIDPVMPVLGEMKSILTLNTTGATKILKVVNGQQRVTSTVNSWDAGYIGEFTMSEASTTWNDKTQKVVTGGAIARVALQVAIPYTDRYGNVYYDSIDTEYSTADKYNSLYKKYVAVSSDPGVVMIDDMKNAANSLYIPLIANQVGEASIIIYGVPFDNKAPKEVVGIAGIVVEPKRVADDFVVEFANTDKSNLNTAWADDKVKINVKVLDQYGRVMDGKKFDVEKTKDTTGPVLKWTKKSNIQMGGTKWKGGLYGDVYGFVIDPSQVKSLPKDDPVLSLTFTSEDKESEVIDIAIARDTTKSYETLKLAYNDRNNWIYPYFPVPTYVNDVLDGDVSAFNTNVTLGLQDVAWGQLHANIRLQGVTDDGYATSGSAIYFVEKEPEWTDGMPGWASKKGDKLYVYTVSKDGKVLTRDNINVKDNGKTYVNLLDTYNNVLSGVGVAESNNYDSTTGVVTGGAIEKVYKLDAGEYTITAWELEYDGKGVSAAPIEDKTITVNDNQLLPGARKTNIAEKLDKHFTKLPEAFVVDFGDYEYLAWQDYDVEYTTTIEGAECFVSKITVTFNVRYDGWSNAEFAGAEYSVSIYPNTVLRSTDSQ